MLKVLKVLYWITARYLSGQNHVGLLEGEQSELRCPRTQLSQDRVSQDRVVDALTQLTENAKELTVGQQHIFGCLYYMEHSHRDLGAACQVLKEQVSRTPPRETEPRRNQDAQATVSQTDPPHPRSAPRCPLQGPHKPVLGSCKSHH